MKNYLFIVIVAYMSLLVSCQNSSSFDDSQYRQLESQFFHQSNSDESELVIKLQSFNDSLINNSTSVQSNNQSSSDFFKAIDIAYNDLLGTYKGAKLGWKIGLLFGPNGGPIGASIGGPIIGAAKSYSTYLDYKNKHNTRSVKEISLDECIAATISMRESNLNYSDYYPQIINLNLPDELTELKLYGAQHNLILNNLQKQIFSTTAPELAFDSISYSIISHPLFINGFIQIGLGQDPKQNPITRYDVIGDKVISLYMKALKNAKSYSEVEFISNRYINEVSLSNELDDQNENGVISSFCVMASSSEYWDIF